MTVDDIHIRRLSALKCCSFVPGTNPKRFVRDTALDAELSERQRGYIDILAWKFRRQLPTNLVPETKPEDLPPKLSKKKGSPQKHQTQTQGILL